MAISDIAQTGPAMPARERILTTGIAALRRGDDPAHDGGDDGALHHD